MRQPPELFGVTRSRWRVRDLRAAVRWAAGYSLSGLGRALKQLGVGRQRGRLRLHSPDPAYREKEWDIRHLCALALGAADPPVVLYGDEFSLYRQPTLGPAFAPAGGDLAAALSCRSNRYHRYAGALNAAAGQLTWLARATLDVPNLRRFLDALRAAYPARPIHLIWDNWPAHHHPAVLAHAAALGIALLWLPTYAPWLNPIEKVWRRLSEDLLRHHTKADRFDDLQRQVADWLDRFAHPNRTLLRYVGLADGLPGP